MALFDDEAVQMTTLRPAFWHAPMPERLLPGRLRMLAVVLLLAGMTVPVILVVHFVGRGQPGSLDSAIDPFIMRSWRQSVLSHGLVDLGSLGPVALMTAALVVACAVTQRWSGAVLAAVAAPAAAAVTDFIIRPYVGGPLGTNFSSKHAATSFALAAVCGVLLANPPRQRLSEKSRFLLGVLAVVLATAAAVSVVADGVHTFTDALSGMAVGTVVVLLCCLLLDFVAARWSRFTERQPTELTGGAHEVRVWSYFHDYVDSGKPGYTYVLRHPVSSLAAGLAIFWLHCLHLTPSAGHREAETIRRTFSSPTANPFSPRTIVSGISGFAAAALVLPHERGQYSLGASKQTLRRKIRRAQKQGVYWAEVNDQQERQRLIKLAEEYEKIHPDETYRNADSDLSWLLDQRLWLVAYSAGGDPILLSVTPIDGEFALLGHFRTIGSGDEQSDARYLMTDVLVEQLVDRGCAISPMGEAWPSPMGSGISSGCSAFISSGYGSRDHGEA